MASTPSLMPGGAVSGVVCGTAPASSEWLLLGDVANLKSFSLNPRHFHTWRANRHSWNRETSNVGAFLKKALNRRSRHMPFDHISPHNSGMTRLLLGADTSRFLHGNHVPGDVVIEAETR